MELIKSHSYVKAETLSESDAEILDEIKHIKESFKMAEQIKNGKLKTRPIEDLLNEL